ncbi:Bifunctional nuclease domain-containing protein [Artemisia annua]|uniref:Bifunctional nuclease domain-containing protein n=1 Tax=Artemisia annua TaxID=35608 RepID=A0A2U1Q527_ARTAN|nr:Bifunctional nuclease domain-containing protein [Artemisia annua]
MLRLQLHARTLFSSGAGDFSDHQRFLFTNHRSVSYSTTTSTKLNPHLCKNIHCHRRSKNITTTCNYASGGRSNSYGYGFNDDSGDDYFEAIVLMTETLLHYQMRIQGYQEAIKWQRTRNLHPLFGQGKGHRTNMQTIGPEFLSQFRSPTIFLKIPCNCDEDYLLPIIVAESAVEKLITSSLEDQGSPNQFQLVRNIVGKLGYQVKLIQITERMDDIYVANICFHKPGTEDIRVDARPSDAINVATRCRAPIYVSKHIVLTDAIKIVYEKSKLRNRKPVYDVFLDSAIDGPDELAEELDLVAKMNLAAKEERYSDAAMWKDKLLKIRSLRKEA